MELPEDARKARRSSRKVKSGLPRVAELLTDLGFSRQDPALDKALRRELDDTLKAFTEKFFARKNLQRKDVTDWKVQSYQDIFRQLATSFLQEGGRGSYFWPDSPSAANKKGYCFSKDPKKICDLLMPLAFRRNKDWASNQEGKLKQQANSTTTTPTNTIQQQAAQQQNNSSETTSSHAVSASHISRAHGSSFETPIDVDGLPDFDLNSFNDYGPSDDEAPRNPKYLRDPGFPSPELSLPPMAPPPATVEDEIDEYYLETPKHAPREQTQTVAPEETDPGPTQDPYDVPNSPETVASPINQGEKRPAETEIEDSARRTKSPRLEQGSAMFATECSSDDDDEPLSHSRADRMKSNNTSEAETRQARLYDYVLPDGLDGVDGLPGPTSYQGSPELGEDAHREILARRSAAFGPPAKAPLALMSDAPDSEPEAEAEASRKQPETDPLEGAPLDEPHKAQACPREGSPQGNVSSAPPETDGDIQDKPKSHSSHPDKPEQPVPVIKGKQQPKEPQVEEVLTHEPARDATSNPDLTFAFTVYQTEMCPRTWNYSERDFFNGSLRELVDELPMENKHSLRGLCITLMAKLPDQYQVFLYNEVKYRNVKEIYLTTIKQEMQEAKLDGSRLDYELIIRPIR